jgi:hypothetical protein
MPPKSRRVPCDNAVTLVVDSLPGDPLWTSQNRTAGSFVSTGTRESSLGAVEAAADDPIVLAWEHASCACEARELPGSADMTTEEHPAPVLLVLRDTQDKP